MSMCASVIVLSVNPPAHWELEAAAWHSQTMATQDNTNKMPGIISRVPVCNSLQSFRLPPPTPFFSLLRHKASPKVRIHVITLIPFQPPFLSKKPRRIQSTFISRLWIEGLCTCNCVVVFFWEKPAITPGGVWSWLHFLQCNINIWRLFFFCSQTTIWLSNLMGQPHTGGTGVNTLATPWIVRLPGQQYACGCMHVSWHTIWNKELLTCCHAGLQPCRETCPDSMSHSVFGGKTEYWTVIRSDAVISEEELQLKAG